MTRHMNVGIMERLNMFKEEIFYRLKYPILPDKEQLVELQSTEFGKFVLLELVSSIIFGVITNMPFNDQLILIDHVEKNIVEELDELFREDSFILHLEEYAKPILDDLIELLLIVDEMENE